MELTPEEIVEVKKIIAEKKAVRELEEARVAQQEQIRIAIDEVKIATEATIFSKEEALKAVRESK